MKELDVVELKAALPDEGLQAGARGTVVYAAPDDQAFEVEFPELAEADWPCVTVTADQVRVISSAPEPEAVGAGTSGRG